MATLRPAIVPKNTTLNSTTTVTRAAPHFVCIHPLELWHGWLQGALSRSSQGGEERTAAGLLADEAVGVAGWAGLDAFWGTASSPE